MSKADIIFPVTELGGCKDEADCRAYCEKRDNVDVIRACLTFAKKAKLVYGFCFSFALCFTCKMDI